MSNSATSLRGPALLIVLACILAGALAACSEDPTEANAIVSPVSLKDYTFRDTVIYADTTLSFRHYMPMNGTNNLVGRYGGYQAFTIIQFTPAYLPERDTAQVYAATLRLKAVSWFGNSAGTVAFDVYRVMQPWNPSTFAWDSLQSGFYEQNIVRGTYSGIVGADSEWISVSLDTAMVREWLATNTSTTTTKYGIILVPTPGSTVVRGFYEYTADTSLAPSLQIIAGSPTGAARDTNAYIICSDTFVGNIDGLVSNPSLLYIQSGVVYRSTIHFNLSSIPRAAIINSAEMLLDQDPTNSSLNRFSGDLAVVAHQLLSSSDTTQYTYTQYQTGTVKTGTTGTFAFNLRREAQAWLKESNFGVVLGATSYLDQYSARDREQSSFDLYAFFNQRAVDPSHRPRLKIIYAVTKG